MTDLIIVRVLVPYFALGGLLGAAYSYALGWNVRLYTRFGPGWSVMLVHLARILVIGVVFALCARRGAVSLLSSVAGFQMMRATAVNHQIRALEEKP